MSKKGIQREILEQEGLLNPLNVEGEEEDKTRLI